MSLPTSPESRGEQYLAVMAGQEGAQKPAHPESRMEQYLDYICDNGGGKATEGYYYDGAFYSDSEHTTAITPKKDQMYADITNASGGGYAPLYFYNGTAYVLTGDGTGSEVEANPTLSGGEAALTGLKVGNTKYAVPQGGSTHLYQHNIYIGDDNGQAAFYLITNSDTEFTVNTLIDYLKSCLPSGSSSRKYICSSGFGVIGSTKYILELILVSRNMTQMTASARNPSSGAVTTYTFYNGDPECVDFVMQIL